MSYEGEEEDRRESIKTLISAKVGRIKTQIPYERGRRRQNIHRKEGIKTERFAEGK
jgi:hypothetical protein